MKQTFAEHGIQAHARAHQQARSRPLRKCEHAKEEQGDQRHHQQSARALAHHHTIENLQHVNGGYQHQQIGHHAKNTGHQKLAAEIPQRA